MVFNAQNVANHSSRPMHSMLTDHQNVTDNGRTHYIYFYSIAGGSHRTNLFDNWHRSQTSSRRKRHKASDFLVFIAITVTHHSHFVWLMSRRKPWFSNKESLFQLSFVQWAKYWVKVGKLNRERAWCVFCWFFHIKAQWRGRAVGSSSVS